MSVTLEIIPLSPSLDLYGEPDPSSAYSLPGHVAITLTPSASWFERPRATRVLLQSLTLTFEGKSEIIAPDPGYSAARLCKVSRELVDKPIELSTDDHEDSDKPCIYNIIFDLPVPGWLPATNAHGDAFTRYALFATASFATIEEPASPSSWRSALMCWGSRCMPFGSRPRFVDAQKCDVIVNRYITPPDCPPRSNGQLFPEAVFSVQAHVDPAHPRPEDDAQIPLEILSGIKVVATVPEHIPLTSNSFPLSLRFRTDSTISDEDRRRLRVASFGVELKQCDRYRGRISQTYQSIFPIPPVAQQPPNTPLMSPHPIAAMYDLGLIVGPQFDDCITSRTFALLDRSHPGKFQLAGDGYVFPDNSDLEDADPEEAEPKWYHIDADVPFSPPGVSRVRKNSHIDTLRETAKGPIVATEHQLHITLECTYDLESFEEFGAQPRPEPRRATELLHFTLPLSFVRPSPPRPTLTLTIPGFISTLPLPSSSTSVPSTPGLSYSSAPSPNSPFPSSPYGPITTLPAYNQLFEPNGDRKLDYSLPLYTPSPTSPAYEDDDAPADERAPLMST